MTNDMFRIGHAPKGSTPFYRAEDGYHLDGQNGRVMDYGHMFDPRHGYRVFFAFADAFKKSGAASTWGPDSLLKWVDSVEADTDELRDFLRIATLQAKQCTALNKEWERLGRPAGGVPMAPKGNA